MSMKNYIKAGIAALLLGGCATTERWPEPPILEKPKVQQVVQSQTNSPITVKEQPKPQTGENITATEIPVGYTAENQRAFDYLCGIQSGATSDIFGQMQLAVKISQKPDEGKATLDDLARAFEAIKDEEFKLNYTEIIYAEPGQKEAIEGLVSKAVKDSTLQQTIDFIKDSRCTDKSDLVPAAEIKIGYTIKGKKAFDEYCKAVEEKEGTLLDEFGKMILAGSLDADNDGIVTMADIARGYATIFPGEAQLSYSQPVFAAAGQEKTIAALVTKELEGKDGKGLSLTEKIELVQRLRKKIEQAPKKPELPKLPPTPPTAPNPTPGKYKEIDVPVRYGFERSCADRVAQVSEHEKRKNMYSRIQLSVAMDADKKGSVSSNECTDYIIEKGRKDQSYLELGLKDPAKVKDPANFAALTEKVKVEEGLVGRFNKWLSGKNMYERAKFIEMLKANPALYSTIDNTTMTALEQKEFK